MLMPRTSCGTLGGSKDGRSAVERAGPVEQCWILVAPVGLVPANGLRAGAGELGCLAPLATVTCELEGITDDISGTHRIARTQLDAEVWYIAYLRPTVGGGRQG